MRLGFDILLNSYCRYVYLVVSNVFERYIEVNKIYFRTSFSKWRLMNLDYFVNFLFLLNRTSKASRRSLEKRAAKWTEEEREEDRRKKAKYSSDYRCELNLYILLSIWFYFFN